MNVTVSFQSIEKQSVLFKGSLKYLKEEWEASTYSSSLHITRTKQIFFIAFGFQQKQNKWPLHMACKKSICSICSKSQCSIVIPPGHLTAARERRKTLKELQWHSILAYLLYSQRVREQEAWLGTGKKQNQVHLLSHSKQHW